MDKNCKNEWIYFDRKPSTVTRVILWITSFLNREQLYQLVNQILIMLQNKKKFPRPKNPYYEHPNYRNFAVPERPPIPIDESEKEEVKLNYKTIIEEHIREFGVVILPIRNRKPDTAVDSTIKCNRCEAPSEYLYYNDGKRRNQIRCKVCDNLFQHNEQPIKKKPNTDAHIVDTRFTDGKTVRNVQLTNVAMIIVHTISCG